ncbi:VWA domain-containing protein [Corynebacterium glyciniphilum]|uniref:vWA domain-containing protein n=2 Tax=Corynebacterium glyciniphilum TaxID=1404244 RepID=UPI002653A095|nr:VWA domain-containing protein [Corynebacterium glyciniphilum]MDN5682912.1 VWA domain-containing protein [Corynebacterium glyciniphilum]MDN6706137.1 VWA domain-containing protein [Corynebacterium glyciniphilum]
MFRLERTGHEDAPTGRRSLAHTPHGADIRATSGGHGINLLGTLMAAAERGAVVKDDLVELHADDLRGSLRRGRESNLIVFVVDTSGSMSARSRVRAVTGAVTSMLTDAYQRRDKVAVIAVNGAQPTLVLPPTGSVDVARRRLDTMPVGGRTPLAEGLLMALDLLEREHRREPGRRALLVVMTDGEDTSDAGAPGIVTACRRIVRAGLSGNLVIDCEGRMKVRKKLAYPLAEQLDAPCVRLSEMNSDNLRVEVRL